MTNIYSAKVTPKSGNTLNLNLELPKTGLEIIKNNSKTYSIIIDELFFKIINPQNIPEGRITENIIIKSVGKFFNVLYDIKYEKNLDITTLNLFF